MQLGTVPAWIAAALSFIFGLQSWLSSRKSKAEREEAVRQAERAERAVEAAQRQAHAAERVVALQEAHDQQQIERAEAAEERPFELVPIPGDDNCWLHNTTEAPKYGVQVAGIHVRSAPKRFDVIERGQKKVIDIGRFGQRPGRDHRIHITWHRKQDLSDPVCDKTTTCRPESDSCFAAAEWPRSGRRHARTHDHTTPGTGGRILGGDEDIHPARDPDHPCPLCESESEVAIQTMTAWGQPDEIEVSRVRCCTNPTCEGRKGEPLP